MHGHVKPIETTEILTNNARTIIACSCFHGEIVNTDMKFVAVALKWRKLNIYDKAHI